MFLSNAPSVLEIGRSHKELNQDCREGVKGFPSETLVKLSLQSWQCELEHCHDGTKFDDEAFLVASWPMQSLAFSKPFRNNLQ